MKQNIFDKIDNNLETVIIKPEIINNVNTVTEDVVNNYDLKNAEHIIIAEGTEVIDKYAFDDIRDNIKTIVFPSTLKIIESFVFSKSSLESVTFNGNIDKICKFAFNSCKHLKTLVFNGNIERIGEFAFYDCDITGYLKLPEGLKTIGTAAFCNNKNIERLEFPDGLERIMQGVFCNCKKISGSIILPPSLKYIHNHIFYGCTNIERITINKTNIFMYYKCLNWNKGCNAEIIYY